VVIVHHPDCTEYHTPRHPENPQRILSTHALLRRQDRIFIEWLSPDTPTEDDLLRAHHPALIRSLEQPDGAFDPDTPGYPRIRQYARQSVGGALRAMRSARQGHPALSLMRPPGHHATPTQAMGFCYLNSIAIAALAAVESGIERVAIFDFDVHHGNGTEDIVVDHPSIDFFSVHQFPCYPGTGRENRGSNCFNTPVPPHTDRFTHLGLLEKAWQVMLARRPTLIAISAGFDAYARDPLAHCNLEPEDFATLGRWAATSHHPCFAVLEGGYSPELPELILSFLEAWEHPWQDLR
jgi:acetoin utilization deacetylase AcuC-like enzyme